MPRCDHSCHPTHCEPRKQTSNQKARPCTVPVENNLKWTGMVILGREGGGVMGVASSTSSPSLHTNLCRSLSWAVEKLMTWLAGEASRIRVSKVSWRTFRDEDTHTSTPSPKVIYHDGLPKVLFKGTGSYKG